MNVDEKVNDANIDTEINKNGKKQAKKTGEYLKKIRKLNGDNCHIYTSPALRTVQTASIIKNIINKDIKMISDIRLIETDKGKLSGLSKTDKDCMDFDNAIDKVMKKGDTLYKNEIIIPTLNKLNPKYNAEPLEHVWNRITEFFNELPMDKPNVVLVTHSGIIANIIICVMNIMNITKGDQTKGKNCTITVIKKEKKKESKNANSAKYTLMSFPNTEHL
jgi:broad specificity phosphatase PhoE